MHFLAYLARESDFKNVNFGPMIGHYTSVIHVYPRVELPIAEIVFVFFYES